MQAGARLYTFRALCIQFRNALLCLRQRALKFRIRFIQCSAACTPLLLLARKRRSLLCFSLLILSGAHEIFLVVLNAGTQHCAAALHRSKPLLPLMQRAAQFIGLPIKLMHLLCQSFRMLINLRQPPLRMFQLLRTNLLISFAFRFSRAQRMQFTQPQGNLNGAQLVAQQQILSCFFCLCGKRRGTMLQFAEQIANPHQIFLCRGQDGAPLLPCVSGTW